MSNNAASAFIPVSVTTRACRNRHCPKCQSLARAKWVEARSAELLPVEYFHVVFTLPEQIARIAYYNRKVVYNILFSARLSAHTLLRMAVEPQPQSAAGRVPPAAERADIRSVAEPRQLSPAATVPDGRIDSLLPPLRQRGDGAHSGDRAGMAVSGFIMRLRDTTGTKALPSGSERESLASHDRFDSVSADACHRRRCFARPRCTIPGAAAGKPRQLPPSARRAASPTAPGKKQNP
jgi:hypothetical protein